MSATQLAVGVGTGQRVQETRFGLNKRAKELDDEHGTLATRQDEVTDDLDRARLHRRLRRSLDQARAEVDRAAAELVRIFAAYQLTWEDPTRSVGRTSSSGRC